MGPVWPILTKPFNNLNVMETQDFDFGFVNNYLLQICKNCQISKKNRTYHEEFSSVFSLQFSKISKNNRKT